MSRVTEGVATAAANLAKDKRVKPRKANFAQHQRVLEANGIVFDCLAQLQSGQLAGEKR